MVVVPRFTFSTVRSLVLVKREIRAQSKFLDWDQNIRQGLGRRSNEILLNADLEFFQEDENVLRFPV